MYQFTDGCLRNVWLKDGYAEHTTPYGNGVSFTDVAGLTIAVSLALCNKPGRLGGAEFRYVRTALLLSQKTIGKMFGYTEQAVAKWEKYDKVPKLADAALRLLFIGQHDAGRAVSISDLLRVIDRPISIRIVIAHEGSHWTSSTQPDDQAEELTDAALA